MNRISTKMKLLSLGLLGLGGLALAGSASAATCPSLPGAWSSAFASPSSSSIVTASGGLDGSACKAVSTLGPTLTSVATVTDTSPSNEPSYRFQFLIDPTGLSAMGLTDSVTVFRAKSATAAHGSKSLLKVNLKRGASGTPVLRFIVACNTPPNYRCTQTSPVDLSTSGPSRVEGFLKVGSGSAGSFEYWINAPAGGTAPANTGEITGLDNAAWVGVDRAIMGQSAPSGQYASLHAGEGMGFDTFDSRRNTYIGH